MSDTIPIALILFTPVLALCGLFYWAGTKVTRPRLGPWVRRSAVIVCVLLCTVFALLLVAFGTCGGDMLYGYRDCTLFSDRFADLSLPAFLLAVLMASMYGAGLALVTLCLEWSHRRR